MRRKKQPPQAAKGRPSAWLQTEKFLNSEALKYEKAYFEDMTLQAGSIAGDVFLEYEYEVFSKKKNREYWSAKGAGFNLSIEQYPFKIKMMKGVDGETKCRRKVVFINPELINRAERLRATVLHEMVHAYDWMLDQCYPYPFRDLLTVRLYGKLENKIEDLDVHLMALAHLGNQNRILDTGAGEHGILFYLKCIDLEIRLNLPFGKISGYYPGKKMRLKKQRVNNGV